MLLYAFEEEVDMITKDLNLIRLDEFNWEDLTIQSIEKRINLIKLFTEEADLKHIFLYNVKPL